MNTTEETIIDILDYDDPASQDKVKIKPFYIFIDEKKSYKIGIDINKDNQPKLRNLKAGAYWCIDKIDCINVPGRTEELGNERLAIQKGLIPDIFKILKQNFSKNKDYIVLKIKRPKRKQYQVGVIDNE